MSAEAKTWIPDHSALGRIFSRPHSGANDLVKSWAMLVPPTKYLELLTYLMMQALNPRGEILRFGLPRHLEANDE